MRALQGLSKKWCKGAFYYQEVRSDDAQTAKKILAVTVNPRTKKRLRECIYVAEHFPPGIPSDRLVGHTFEVYNVKNPKPKKWKEDKVLLLGELEQVFAVDLGKELTSMVECPYRSIVERENELYPLGNNRYIEGGRIIRRELCKTPGIIAAKDYLSLSFDITSSMGAYGFSLNFATFGIPAENPVECHITKYFSINGEVINSEKRVMRAIYSQKGDVILPRGRKGFFKEN